MLQKSGGYFCVFPISKLESSLSPGSVPPFSEYFHLLEMPESKV
jgi:hypothetical protein